MNKKKKRLSSDEVVNKLLVNLRKYHDKNVALKIDCYWKRVSGFLMCHTLKKDTILLALHLSKEVPMKKTMPVLELLNSLNQYHNAYNLSLHPQNRLVVMTRILFLSEGTVDEEEFRNSIPAILKYGGIVFPTIWKQITTKISTKVLMKSFLKSVGRDGDICIHDSIKKVLEFEYNDSKEKSSSMENQNNKLTKEKCNEIHN